MRNLGRFLISKTFFIHLSLAFLLTIALIFGSLEFLKIRTLHNQTKVVPNLENMPLTVAKKLVDSIGLKITVLDTITYYDPTIPPLGIIQQTPSSNKEVKEGRNIYVHINRSLYRTVSVPEIVQTTKRIAELKLESAGFIVDSVIEIPRIGKNVVYGIKHQGEKIKSGKKLTRKSSIALVVGNGNSR